MASLVNQVLMQWRDQNNRFATSFMTTLDQTSGGASAYTTLADKLQDCSHCVLEAVQFQQTVIRVGAPTPGDYPTVWDRAVLLANVATTNQPTRVEIPGPKTALFLPANPTVVNLSSPLIVALQTACTAVLGDAHAHAMGPFKRGIRTEARGG